MLYEPRVKFISQTRGDVYIAIIVFCTTLGTLSLMNILGII